MKPDVTHDHAEKNQENYSKAATVHAQFGLKSTLFLAYRDIATLLEKHLFSRKPKDCYRLLDFGCGAGLSTEIYSKTIQACGHRVEVFGVDLSAENLEQAATRLPDANFIKIDSDSQLEIGEFDLVVCNFVLVENPSNKMLEILKRIRSSVTSDGILITTNTRSKTYDQSCTWTTLNAHFEENLPKTIINGTPKLEDDQPVKLEVIVSPSMRFSFFDYFHSGRSYREAFEKAGFTLAETHRPVGSHEDGIEWVSEEEHSPYKIHVLYASLSELEVDLQPVSGRF